MGFKFQTRAQKWQKSILSSRFGDPYGKPGDQCRIRESWKGSFAPSRAPKSPFPLLRPCLQGGRVSCPNKRVTLALHISSFFTRRVYKAGRVTLGLAVARGLTYLPCKRSARDNSPTRPGPTFHRHAWPVLNGIIQFLNLIINIWKIESYFLSTMIIFSLLFVNLTCFPEKNFKII